MKEFKQSDAIQRLPEQFFAKLVKKVNEAKQLEGPEMINLGQGNPDQPTPEHIVQSLQQAAEKPEYHKYSPFQGFDFLKEAVATFYKREYDVDLDPESEVAIMFGSKTGLVEVSQCFLNEGDLALMPDPGYPDYWSGVALANAEMKTMPLLEENDFLPDYTQLDQETLERAKLMFLNYPNNPTSAVADRAFFDKTVELAEANDICVVHDFAYGAIGFDGEKPLSFMQVPGAKDVGVEMYTMSKTFNMAGWRVAFAVGNPSVIQALELIQDHQFVSLFGAVQEATATALLDSQQCVEDLVAMYEKRRDILVEGLQEQGWHIAPPKGSFFMWMRVPEGFTSESFADDLIDKARMVVAPGIGFGDYGEGFVRIGLVNSEEQLKEALNRFEAYKNQMDIS
ncbi:aminotransferase class I/II-fold pyridoxal phosphate-dependent enzyme [Pontibacillus yanchengensis]|uniref:Aminotransferase class I/II-fold pyridoxal phosphate-dependent enzyme n=2 Tax=Pontibacillus yanchengensis TaxID=462910 RepID=A0ACC7VL47_9BACI|nr:pyridoxal phosphate-dependent aminotransferase [Pontibacillus yanchengensis]MYL33672.1 aminotransferase class I/II-fold pyridoxal phosphate-dependent enzyme [Pontibacillus yanchengensis]MYL55430.1 aminotransferase class I/II-fold pyridoxal phosphate-dependent enzyme [Pontibacillus yanchengensis]